VYLAIVNNTVSKARTGLFCLKPRLNRAVSASTW